MLHTLTQTATNPIQNTYTTRTNAMRSKITLCFLRIDGHLTSQQLQFKTATEYKLLPDQICITAKTGFRTEVKWFISSIHHETLDKRTLLCDLNKYPGSMTIRNHIYKWSLLLTSCFRLSTDFIALSCIAGKPFCEPKWLPPSAKDLLIQDAYHRCRQLWFVKINMARYWDGSAPCLTCH